MPAIQPQILEPIWEQFCALLPERKVNHPLGCHRPRAPDRVVFEKLVQVLVFGCAYWRIADEKCSTTTLRRRRDEWIEAGVMDELREMALETYDRFLGLELTDLAVDCCITKAPCGNAADTVKPPKPAPKEMHALSANEARRLLEAAGGDRLESALCTRRPHRHETGRTSSAQVAGRGPGKRRRERETHANQERRESSVWRAEDQ